MQLSVYPLFYCDSNGAGATKLTFTVGACHLPSRPVIALNAAVCPQEHQLHRFLALYKQSGAGLLTHALEQLPYQFVAV